MRPVAVAHPAPPPEVRGRVFGAITALCYAAIPLGLVAGGVLLDLLGIRTTLLAIAAVYVTISLGMRFSSTLREMDDPRTIPPGV